jgi:hypothetical protein
MRIINWNCKYDYYKRISFDENKENIITNENEKNDLYIIEECTYSDCIRLKEKYKYVTWFGDGKDSILGIGTFSQKYELLLIPEFNIENNFRYIIPYYFYENSIKVNIFLVWAKTVLFYQTNDNKKIYDKYYSLEYVNNVLESMKYYKNILNENVVIIGDFNSGITENNINEKHDKLTEYLLQYKINNCSLKYKMEKSPTFFQIDKYGKENAYTDDYCFVSDTIGINNFSIGKKEIYNKYSDHLPIILELKI